MSDINKVFELLEKVYIEVQDTKVQANQRFDGIEKRLDKIETTLEHDIKTNLKVLHERAVNNTDKLEEHSQRLDSIENKLDYLAVSMNSQDKRLNVIETSPKRKAK